MHYLFNQKHHPDLGSGASSVWNFCSRSSQFISRGNCKCRLFSQAMQLSVNKLQDAAQVLRMNKSVKTLPNLRKDWSWNVTKSVTH